MLVLILFLMMLEKFEIIVLMGFISQNCSACFLDDVCAITSYDFFLYQSFNMIPCDLKYKILSL